MSNPKSPLVPNLLKTLSEHKPGEAENRQPGARMETKAPMPKVKASTKPVRSTLSHARSTNRGK
ncbi:hypothetical protein [Holophaga foetida]|uniref:hypothetical protein n=1 Tax=Holophaga foetida TaxID=35839 RepID=UPI00024725D5|nr:hypothetical protein [Holophaga foetida]